MENNPPEKKINKIIKLYKKNKLKEALKEVEIIQNKYKSSATIFNIKGTINAKLKKFEIAIKNYKQAINLQSNNIESHNNLGIIYKETGNLEGAIES